MKTALVIGNTGLVGNALIHLLLENPGYGKVIVFGRRSINLTHPRLEEHIIDFQSPASWEELVKGDVLFSALGTTRAKAGSKNKQYETDYTFQYQFAQAAARNGINNYVLVSSIGANPSSSFFYVRIKGELEREIKKLPFTKIVIIRPAQLYGNRTEKRRMEKVALGFTRLLNKAGLMKKNRPISGQTVAKAMIQSLDNDQKLSVYAANELFNLAEKYDRH